MQMCDFVLDEHDNQVVNHIGRFEQSEELMTVLTGKIGLDSSAVPRAEVLGHRGDYRKAYCSDGVEIIARIYRDDIERFPNQVQFIDEETIHPVLVLGNDLALSPNQYDNNKQDY